MSEVQEQERTKNLKFVCGAKAIFRRLIESQGTHRKIVATCLYCLNFYHITHNNNIHTYKI